MLLKDTSELLVYEVTNEKFELVGIVNVESITWPKYFYKFADVSLKVQANKINMQLLTKGRILSPEGGSDAAIIDIVEVEKTENGELILQIKARTLEVLLSRRVLYGRSVFRNAFICDIATSLVSSSFVTSPLGNRQLPFFKVSEDYPDIYPKLEYSQFTGDSVYENIYNLCETYPQLGYEMQFKPSEKKIVFQILQSNDHTEESENPIIFSSDLNNILCSSYYSSIRDFKNVAYVAGEGTGSDRKVVIVGEDNKSGYDRFEHYVDARDLQKDSGEQTLTDEEYRALLSKRGLEKLSGLKKVDTISGKIALVNNPYVYGVDYKVGDMVTIEDKDIGVRANAQITGFKETVSNVYEAELIIGYEQATLSEKMKNLYG